MTAEIPSIDMMPDGPWATRQKKGEISLLALDVLTEGGYRLHYIENVGSVANKPAGVIMSNLTPMHKPGVSGAGNQAENKSKDKDCCERFESAMRHAPPNSDDADFALPVVTSPHSAEGGAKAEAVAVAGQQFAITETKHETTLPPTGQSAESPKGLGRPANEPLMKMLSEVNESSDPIGNTGGNTFERVVDNTRQQDTVSGLPKMATEEACAVVKAAALIPCPACLTVHPPEAECDLADIGRRFEAIAELARFERRKYAMNRDLKQRKEAEENTNPF
jgi:hypothetical protein